MPTFPILLSVPGAVANMGVYAAIFGDSGPGSPESPGPQVFLASQTGSDGNSIVATGTLASAVTLPADDSLTIDANDSFPTGGGSLLLTATDQYGNITAQATVSYTSFDPELLVFGGVSGGSGTFAAVSTQVTLALAWTLSSTLAEGAAVPLLNLFPNLGSYSSAEVVGTVVNLPDPGLTNVGGIPSNSIYSGELVLFVGPNAGLQANSALELAVPTLGTNPNDIFGLLEWGLAGALTPNSGGFIDYDVSAIDQVGFPFQVTTQISNGAGEPPGIPPQPFNQGVGFLQDRSDLFSGFATFLLSQPAASAAWAFMSLAPENSLFAERITAPQDLLDFVLSDGPAFAQAPAGISGFQPIQTPPSTTSTATFSVNPASWVVQAPGSGYTSAPTLTFSAPPTGTTATATAVITAGAVTSVDITNVGSGYVTAPTITVSPPPAGGTQAAVAVGLAGLIFYYAVTALRVSVAVTDGGSGYTSAPSVTFSAPTAGTTASGLAILGSGSTAGQVVSVFVTNPGSGYTSPPTVSFSGGGGGGAGASASLVESMATGPAQQAQINEQTMAVLNWMPFPYATAYNVYRSQNADMGASVVLNSAPYTAVSLPAGTTLAAAASSTSTSVTISATPPATVPSQGTLLISQGEGQSLFQYTSVNASTFSGAMFGNASFTPGAAVSLLPNFVDAGSAGTIATPPANNYGYEPLNQYFTAALQDFFDYYRSNQFEIDLAGNVSTKWTGNTIDITIDDTTYTVLQLTGEQGQYGGTYAGSTANIYQPFFSSNTVPSAFNPPITPPQPPSWLSNPAESPSAMVFGADGVFDTPDNSGITDPLAPLSTAPTAIVKDIMNPINAALNRGLTPRNDSGTWGNVLSPMYWAQAPLFPLAASPSPSGGSLAQGTVYYAITGVNVNGDTSGQETIPGNIVTVALSSANQNSVTLTIPDTGATTFSAFNIYRGTALDDLLQIGSVTPSASGTTSFTDDGSSSGTTPPPFLMNAPGQLVNWYAAYLHQLSVSINGFAYGTPYDDQGSFSTNVNLTYTGLTPQPPQGLTIILLSWAGSAAGVIA